MSLAKCLSGALGVVIWLAAQSLSAQPPEKLEPAPKDPTLQIEEEQFPRKPLDKLEPPPEDPTLPRVKMYTPEETIAIFQKKVDSSPENVFLLNKLGQAHLFAARQTGKEEHYLLAEKIFQKVLKLSPQEMGAKTQLASCLMAQHKFQEALALSQEVYKKNAENTLALANIGDAQLELGRYDEAEKTFADLKKAVPGEVPEVLARLSRIAEVRGRTSEAIELLEKALESVKTNSPLSPEIAWYESILAEVCFNSNRLDKADEHFQASLKRKEKNVAALLGLGQVRAAQGRYQEACALYEDAVAQKPDFDLIGDLATLYGLAGNEGKAKELEDKAISLIPVAQKIETEARHLALFLANREIQLDLALESARKELKVREDVHAYDVLAWVLFKAGQKEAAWEAMQNALRVGTRDAKMHYHAGMIARGLGQTKLAQDHLAKALEINPHFGFTEAEEARKILEDLKAKT